MSTERRSTRKSLKTLQQTTVSRENLTGRNFKGPKHHLSQESIGDGNVKRRLPSTKDKDIQVNLDDRITADDLTNPDGASEKYWQVLAEKRHIALQEVLEENHKLRGTIEQIQKELAEHKQMLEEANSFVEVIKEELASCSKDDTGIDVDDVSTADETTDETLAKDD